MKRTPQTKATLPEHITTELDKYAGALETTRGQYLADIVKWWFGQGCPAVTEHEKELRKKSGARRAS